MKTHNILGMRIDYLSPDEGAAAVIAWAEAGKAGYCCVPNVHQCIETRERPGFREVVNNATFVWSDSAVLQAARSLRHGEKLLPVIKGADMMRLLLAAAAARGIPVGLYGASEKTIEILREKLPGQFPGLNLAYALSPPFRPLSAEEDAAILKDIKLAGVRLLFIGLGCPKQERWMAEHTDKLPGTMMIGVGAAFDFNAGTVPPSPGWVHKAGLEWLYRLVREPRRLGRRYLTTSPKFLVLLAWDMLRTGFRSGVVR